LTFLIAGAVIGVLCYISAQRFGNEHGRFPGNTSPIVWGIIGFLFGLIGALVQYFVGRSTVKKMKEQRPIPAHIPAWSPPPAPGYPHLPAQPQYAPPTQFPSNSYSGPPAQQQYQQQYQQQKLKKMKRE
jgi:hypothetical protein